MVLAFSICRMYEFGVENLPFVNNSEFMTKSDVFLLPLFNCLSFSIFVSTANTEHVKKFYYEFTCLTVRMLNTTRGRLLRDYCPYFLNIYFSLDVHARKCQFLANYALQLSFKTAHFTL